jgi:hypothetical protein
VTWTRPEHGSVGAVLAALDADLLAATGFAFGGGTRIVLEFGEYRLSRDVDFLGSDREGYARLRTLVRERGAHALFAREAPGTLTVARADQYGVRFAVRAAEGDLKVEFVVEGRIGLEPAVRPPWSPVPCLALADCFAEKLLANSDRWADRQVCARDLIDLAVLRARSGPAPERAWRRAEAAYGNGVREDLRRAIAQFRELPGFADSCARRLDLSDRAAVDSGIELLLADSA